MSRWIRKVVAGAASLRKLATDSARNSVGGVHVSKEARWVGLDLGDVEASAGVLAVGHDTGGEGALETADAGAVVAEGLRVGESEAWRAGLALDGLVDVGGSLGCGLVVDVAEVLEADVVADQVEVAVDAEVVVADGALLAAGQLVVAADDLLWDGLDVVGGGVWDGAGRALFVSVNKCVRINLLG